MSCKIGHNSDNKSHKFVHGIGYGCKKKTKNPKKHLSRCKLFVKIWSFWTQVRFKQDGYTRFCLKTLKHYGIYTKFLYVDTSLYWNITIKVYVKGQNEGMIFFFLMVTQKQGDESKLSKNLKIFFFTDRVMNWCNLFLS